MLENQNIMHLKVICQFIKILAPCFLEGSNTNLSFHLDNSNSNKQFEKHSDSLNSLHIFIQLSFPEVNQHIVWYQKGVYIIRYHWRNSSLQTLIQPPWTLTLTLASSTISYESKFLTLLALSLLQHQNLGVVIFFGINCNTQTLIHHTQQQNPLRST